jgi:hypothetical protein
MRLLSVVLILMTMHPFSLAKAEYRVFVLKLTKKVIAAAPSDKNPSPLPLEPPDFRLIESTLDNIQYPYYYPVAPDEEVAYYTSWRCRGRTDNFKPHCPNPNSIKTSPAKDQITQPNSTEP